jgi:hypothetical protein
MITAKLKDKVISKGYKVQNSNHLLATSNMRGVVPCLINYTQIVYKSPCCKPYAVLPVVLPQPVVTNTITVNPPIIQSVITNTFIPVTKVIPCIPTPPIVTVVRLLIDSNWNEFNNYALNIECGGPVSSHRFLIRVDGGGP